MQNIITKPLKVFFSFKVRTIQLTFTEKEQDNNHNSNHKFLHQNEKEKKPATQNALDNNEESTNNEDTNIDRYSAATV